MRNAPERAIIAPMSTSSAPPPLQVSSLPSAGGVAVILLVDIAPGSLTWGLARFVMGRTAARHIDGVRFWKVLGSGHQGGFGLRPSGSRQGLFCGFDDDDQADSFLRDSPLVDAYRRHASEFLAVKLRAFSSRGSWDGAAMTVTATPPAGGPVAALTRASIRPFHAWSFWRNAPPAELSLAGAQGCRLAAGLGEAPLLRQATFTIWDSIACMDAYARSGAHLAAIRAAHRGHYFSESMFVRFVPYAAEGEWKGRRLEL